MKPFSPLKPLIAAMFVLAAASASAAVGPSTVTATSSADTPDFAIFSQSFTVTGPSLLSSWTFFGSQDVQAGDYSFYILGDTGLIDTFTGTYSNVAGVVQWSYSDMNLTLGQGTYFANLGFESGYGTVSMNLDAARPEPASLTLGNYETNAEGTSTTFNSGYQYTATITAVPEPESYAMLLAGLGLMGAIARRRSRKV